MSTLSRICLGLALFLVVTGGVYGLTSHEHAGTTELLVSAVTFCFLGVILRLIGAREAEGQPEEEAEIQVAPKRCAHARTPLAYTDRPRAISSPAASTNVRISTMWGVVGVVGWFGFG